MAWFSTAKHTTLFAQHYPHAATTGPMHWAHAVSKDLIHWRHLPIALYPDHLGMCFSGSACMIGGKIALMYTSHGEEVDFPRAENQVAPARPHFSNVFEKCALEQQSVAFSEDGVHFTPYAGNPVLPNPGLRDYRDPKLFWNDALQEYGVAVAAGDHVAFYASKDLLKWRETGSFSDQSRVSGIHECPDMFPLTAPNGSTVYAMIASMIPPAGGNRTQYVLGDFDGAAFSLTHPFPEPEWIDAGWDDYAPVTFYGAPERIMIGWASHWKYCERLPPTGDYAGVMTFPRKLSLVKTPLGLRLAQTPLVDLVTGSYQKTAELPGESFRIQVHAEGDFRLTLKNAKGERLTIALESGAFVLDRRASGECGAAFELLGPDFGVARRARFFEGPRTARPPLRTSASSKRSPIRAPYAATLSAFPTSPYTAVECENCTAEVAELA